MNDQSVYIIKPEGIPYRQNIRDMIMHDAGLAIINLRVDVILPERVLMKLYYGPTITEEIWRAIVQNMTSGPCEIGIVWGMNAMERLLRVCGDKTDPAECFWGTIRHTFGRQFPPIPIGEKYLYYRNVIHRPKKESELEENLTLLRQFFS